MIKSENLPFPKVGGKIKANVIDRTTSNLKGVKDLISGHLHREPILFIVVEEPLKFYWL